MGPTILARRLSPRLASFVRGLLGALQAGSGATRFLTSQVKQVAIEVMLDVLAEETPARDVEHWLRDHVVSRIPGSGVKG